MIPDSLHFVPMSVRQRGKGRGWAFRKREINAGTSNLSHTSFRGIQK